MRFSLFNKSAFSYNQKIEQQTLIGKLDTVTPWYYSTKVDKYIFIAFTWLVWDGFLTDFGFGPLFFTAHLFAKITPLFNFIEIVSQVVQPVYTLTEIFWQPSTFNVPFFESGWSGLFNSTTLFNPNADIDFTVLTDCEDLVAFANDLFEFAEQDRSLLIDSITNFAKNSAWTPAVACLLRGLSNTFFKRK